VKAQKRISPAYIFPSDLAEMVEELDHGLESLFLAWEISSLAGEANSEERRSVTIIALACLLAAAEGHTRIEGGKESQLERMLDRIAISPVDQSAVQKLTAKLQKGIESGEDSSLVSVFGLAGDYCPLLYDHGFIYLQKFHLLESRVSLALCELIDSQLPVAGNLTGDLFPADIERALHDVTEHPPVVAGSRIILDSDQQQAVKRALGGRITVVSGRPGSGKTAIVADMLRVIARLKSLPPEAVALAAPTGKAADRLRASIIRHLAAIPNLPETDRLLAEHCPPAQTIHRLLSYSPAADRFRHNEHNPLSAKLVIVDESSMLDLALTDHLLRALQPGAKVVLLGDADQLPPIDTGAVLRDLCYSKRAVGLGRVVMLKNSYRTREEESGGAKILAFAAAVNSGTYCVEADSSVRLKKQQEVSGLDFEGVELLSPGDERQRLSFFESWFEKVFGKANYINRLVTKIYHQNTAGFSEDSIRDLEQLFSYYEQFRILCVTRITAGGTGSDFANRWFHQRWQRYLREAGLQEAGVAFATGEPIIVNRNDYRLRLYNGDSGIVLRVSNAVDPSKKSFLLMAVFQRGGNFIAYPLEALRGRIELAWATTVHKAQGSEYDDVAILLPETLNRTLSRELLYTAVTRARNSVVIVGSTSILEEGIKNRVTRVSGIADALDRDY
jgi:exodeoxyribonuclease V alpha subunit